MKQEKISSGENHAVEPERLFEHPLNSAAESVASEKHPEKNEDAFLERRDLGVFGIFDGLGGHGRGDEASRVAAGFFEEYFEKCLRIAHQDVSIKGWKKILHEAFSRARTKILGIKGAKGEKKSPDTTAVVAKITDIGSKLHLVYGSVGDSRLYIKRASAMFLEQLTEDDNYLKRYCATYGYPREEERMIQELLDNFETEKELQRGDLHKGGSGPGPSLRDFFHNRGGLGRTLGRSYGNDTEPKTDFQVSTTPLELGDIILLTSDGVHDNLTFKAIEKTIQEHSDPKDLARILIEQARELSKKGQEEYVRANPDDMSVVAVEIK